MKLIYLTLSLPLLFPIAASAQNTITAPATQKSQTKNNYTKATLFHKAGEPFVILEFELPVDRYRQPPSSPNKKGETPAPLLHPVFHSALPLKGKENRRWLALCPASRIKDLQTQNFTFGLKNTPLTLNLDKNSDSSQYDKVWKEWEVRFRKHLQEVVNKEEDTEMESLLYLKHFGKLPQKLNSWKRDDMADILFQVCGFKDAQDAFPQKISLSQIDKASKEVNPPSFLTLPQVETPETKLEKGISPSSSLVPRSCYYLEFPNWESCVSNLAELGKNFDQWSPHTWPVKTENLLKTQLLKMGLPIENLQKQSSKIGRVTISGWDPYFQSGTSLLLILEEKEPINILWSSVPHFRHQGHLVISPSPKLLKMSKEAAQKGKSLRDVNNFRYVRNKLKLEKKDDREQFFLYLSDYWFTNLLSPRWQILTRRRYLLDSRIRMARMLQLIDQQESGSESLPEIDQLKNKYAEQHWAQWLLNDLTEKKGRIQNSEGNYLYNHQPIDYISFKKCTQGEHDWYQKTINSYRRRWEAMDPLALQGWSNPKKPAEFRTRLYLAPISLRSQFRQISGFILQQKLKHERRVFKGDVAGISAYISTSMAGVMLPQIKLPTVLQLGFTLQDFSPRFLRSSEFKKDEFSSQSQLSYMRLPGYAEIPSAIIPALTRMGNVPLMESEYPGLQTIPENAGGLMSPLILSKEGRSYVGLLPSVLQRLQMQKGEIVTQEISSDIHAFADFNEGPLLRHRMFYEAIKNRSLAAARREHRFTRLQHMLALKKPQRLKQDWQKLHLFNKADSKLAHIAQSIPVYRDYPKDLEQNNYYRRYGRDIMTRSFIQNLPEWLTQLKRVDAYISIFQDSLLFEQTWQMELPTANDNNLRRRNGRPNTQQNQTELDFE